MPLAHNAERGLASAWLGFRPRHVRLAFEVLTAYMQARRALKRSPIAMVVARLRADAAAVAPADGLSEARRLGSAVSRALSVLPGDTRCLMRSLVLTRLLARRGIPAMLVIGARPAPDFVAHAWVEHDGEPVLSSGGGAFVRLVEL
jgi:Transglutaminase-like superfamily